MFGNRGGANLTSGAPGRRGTGEAREQALREARRRHPSARSPRVAPGTATEAIDDGEATEPGAPPHLGGHVLVVVPPHDPAPHEPE